MIQPFKNEKAFHVEISEFAADAEIDIFVNMDKIDEFIKEYERFFTDVDGDLEEIIRHLAWTHFMDRGSGGCSEYFVEGFGVVYNRSYGSHNNDPKEYSTTFQVEFSAELELDPSGFDVAEITKGVE